MEFEKYVNMIRKRAHYFSIKYHFEYEELEAEGFEIYCKCLKTFDLNKGVSFGTHLYINLNRLVDYIEYNYRNGFMIENNHDELEKVKTFNDSNMELIEVARKTLNEKSYKLLEFIMSFDWYNDTHRKPSVSQMMEYMNMTRKSINKILEDLKRFWNFEGIYCYD